MRPKPRFAALETMEREIVQTPLVLERQENLRHIYSNLVQVLESRDRSRRRKWRAVAPWTSANDSWPLLPMLPNTASTSLPRSTI